MPTLDSLKLAASVRQRLVDYASDQNYVSSKLLAEKLRQLWLGDHSAGRLVSDIWVEGTFPSEQVKVSLIQAAEDGFFDRDLPDLLIANEALPKDSNLYTHQYESLKVSQAVDPSGKKPAILVTAGTGAGKTEAFLLPALNQLAKSSRNGTGMRC